MKILPWNEIYDAELYVRGIIGVSQIWGDITDYRSFNYMELPRRSSGFVLYLSSGTVYRFPNGTEYAPEAGDLMSIPAGSRYCVSGGVPARSYLIVFHLFDENGEELILSENATCLLHRSGIRFLDTFEKISRLYQFSSRSRLEVQCECLTLLNRLAEVIGTKNASPVAPAIDYISEHLLEETGIPVLAGLCFMSESTFRREFKRTTGLSPMRWILTEKIKKACQLLSENDLTVREIADLLVFFDETHFRKVFKAFTGMTPSQYRRSCLASELL